MKDRHSFLNLKVDTPLFRFWRTRFHRNAPGNPSASHVPWNGQYANRLGGMSDICLAKTIKHSSAFLQAATGVVLTVFKPQVPAIVPTAEGLLKSLVDTQSDVGFCVPLFIEVRYAQARIHARQLLNYRS